jgi:hypothetical protein
MRFLRSDFGRVGAIDRGDRVRSIATDLLGFLLKRLFFTLLFFVVIVAEHGA